MRWFADTLESARQSSLLLIRSRMVALLVAACVVAAVGFWMVAREAAPEFAGDELFGIVTYMVFFQFGLPFAVLYFGVSALHGEIEDRTVTYLFVRPVRRSSLLLGRWLAVCLVGSALSALAMVLLYTGFALPSLPWSRGLSPTVAGLGSFVVAGAMTVTAYAAVGVCFGAVFRRPIIWGIAFVVGWEIMVSHSPPQAGVRGMTVADPVRRWLIEALQPTGELEDVLVRNLSRFSAEAEKMADPVRSLGYFTIAMLIAALWVYTRREYDSRPRE